LGLGKNILTNFYRKLKISDAKEKSKEIGFVFKKGPFILIWNVKFFLYFKF